MVSQWESFVASSRQKKGAPPPPHPQTPLRASPFPHPSPTKSH